MPELMPGGFYSGYLTMATGMGQNYDRMARLNQFLAEAPLEAERKRAELESQKFQNQNAMTMMQARLQGTPFEQQKFAEEAAIKRQELQRQSDMLQNTLRHQTETERIARESSARAQEAATRAQRTADRVAGQTSWKHAMDAYNEGLGPFPGVAPGMGGGGAFSVGDAPLSHKQAELAGRLRDDMTKQLNPLTALESDIAQTRQLLKTGSPLAHGKINEKLLSLLDPNRTSAQLLARNQQFGDLIDRTVGVVGKFVTGKYTEEQQQQIQSLVDEMESRVVSPAKQEIVKYYKNLAKQSRIPESQLETPDFYGNTKTSGQAPKSEQLIYKGYRFPSQAALNKYKKDNGLE